MKRTLTILLAFFCTAFCSVAAERPLKMGKMQLVGSIHRDAHVYRLHLEHPLKLADGSMLDNVQLSDTKFKKLAEFDTMTAAQIGTGRYAVLGSLIKHAGGLRVEVVKCKPLDL